MVYKNFEEFNRKIRPYWGRGHFTKKSTLISQLLDHHDKKEKNKELSKEKKSKCISEIIGDNEDDLPRM